MNTLQNRIRTAFYKGMQVQFFISLISLPVLVAWGLPFSLMTVIGNLFFTPFLMLFLLISSLIFFLQLLALPNQWCIAALEKIYALWMYLLQFGSMRWLYGIDQMGLIICTLTACAALIILQHKYLGRPKKSVPLFVLLLIIPFLYQTARSWFSKETSICCIKKTIDLKSNRGKINAYDRGALGEKKSSGTWVQYTLLSEALKKCGCLQFDTIECPYPNPNSLKGLYALCNHASIDRISIHHPYTRSKEYKKEFEKLKQVAQEKKIVLEQIAFQTKGH